jgi:hypothetical protein
MLRRACAFARCLVCLQGAPVVNDNSSMSLKMACWYKAMCYALHFLQVLASSLCTIVMMHHYVRAISKLTAVVCHLG